MTSSLRENECVRFHCQSEGGSCLAGRTGPERQSRSGNITIDTDAQVGILCKGAFFPESTHPMNVMGKAYSIHNGSPYLGAVYNLAILAHA